jgi:hypothetical protein
MGPVVKQDSGPMQRSSPATVPYSHAVSTTNGTGTGPLTSRSGSPAAPLVASRAGPAGAIPTGPPAVSRAGPAGVKPTDPTVSRAVLTGGAAAAAGRTGTSSSSSSPMRSQSTDRAPLQDGSGEATNI